MAVIDVTGATASTTIDGVIFSASGPIGSGSGIYNPILAIGDNDGNESGFSSNAATDPNVDQAKTVVIPLSSIPIRYVGGIAYYEFRLDLNETNSGQPPNEANRVSLNSFKIYTSDVNTLLNESGTPKSLVYDLDATGGGNTLQLFDRNSGSGSDDYTILVPVEKFGDAILNPTTTFLYLQADVGTIGNIYAADGGFEEFNSQQASTISGFKFKDFDGDGVRDAGDLGLEGFTIYVDLDNDNKLDFGEQFAQTAADGSFTLNSILAGDKLNGQNFTTVNYTIREVLTAADIGDGWISPEAAELAATFLPPTGLWDQTTGVQGGAQDGDQVFSLNAPGAYTGLLVGNFLAAPSLAIDKLFVNVTGGDGRADRASGDVTTTTSTWPTRAR